MNNLGFPQEFVDLIAQGLDSSECDSLLAALNTEGATSVRLNPYKGLTHSFCSSVELVPWGGGQGLYLDPRPQFTLDPIFHAGAYYVQEASSMIVGAVAAQFTPSRVLDLCAAPGGKSTHLASVVGAQGVVVANEVIKSRASILKENCIKWGSGNIVVTSSDPRNFSALDSMFDLVVVDTPCSGEGMFRKDHNARAEWSLSGVDNCVLRSKRIISDCWNALQVGGVMIYSTCTFNHLENEETVKWICQELSAEVIPQDWAALGALGAVDNGQGAHFYPHRSRGEGLFCAVLRKTGYGSESVSVKPRAPRKMDRATSKQSSYLNGWVGSPLNYRVVDKTIYGYNRATSEIIEELLSNLNVLYSGVEMGEMIREELKPAHSLALYYDNMFSNRSEIDYDQALSYLRRADLDHTQFSMGLTLVTHNSVALGWAKTLPNRVNNNYPQAWRIRM